ncbi:LolA-like outer membrane lipoprotein chaperone [Arcobacter sp. CECT 8985]|uniref:LolA-like outer membrane lipoprotein chaperone n=1 Tax=Arcobacter sp. CECT 8985 TaxID=1935424 RepID=UPI00100BA54D|nr:LolA-like outer membrane lipoprotein chaperone [Arcobacter sp. CECT 8985]RXJ87033.1 cell envelope biogenesis protein LolA [Arcobacter sp. CECT 8985]
MFYKIIIFLGIFFISFANANIFKNINSFQADFVQLIKNSSNKNIEYKGQVFIKNDGKVLWRYKSPIIKNVYINKNFAIVDEPELEQAIFTSLDKKIDIVKLLNSAKKVGQNKYSAKLYNVDYEIVVKDKKISEILYKDELENKITIKFSNIKQNISLDDKIFKFTAPNYYDIIRK